MDVRQQTAELNRTPIHVVGVRLGVRLPERGAARCPLPDHEDKHPSFHISESGARWICFGCNRKGGPIDLVMHVLGVDFRTAREWLLTDVGICAPALRDLHKDRVPRLAIAEQITAETPPDSDAFDAALKLCPLSSRGRAYLEARAISIKTAQAFQVGEVQSASAIVQALVAQFGHDRLWRSGLLAKSSTAQKPHLVFRSSSLIFPFLEGRIVASMQARYFGSAPGQVTWQNLRGRRRRLYNSDALNGYGARIAICEGIMDTLSAVQLRLNAVGLLGVSGKLTLDQMRALQTRRVSILLDWDNAGEARASSLKAELQQYGIEAERPDRPSPTASDLNEYLVERKQRQESSRLNRTRKTDG